jgi:hypothetical protein
MCFDGAEVTDSHMRNFGACALRMHSVVEYQCRRSGAVVTVVIARWFNTTACVHLDEQKLR